MKTVYVIITFIMSTMLPCNTLMSKEIKKEEQEVSQKKGLYQIHKQILPKTNSARMQQNLSWRHQLLQR